MTRKFETININEATTEQVRAYATNFLGIMTDEVEDPEVLAEPWKMNPRTLTLRPDDEIEEAAFCEDRDTSLKQDLSYHSNIR